MAGGIAVFYLVASRQATIRLHPRELVCSSGFTVLCRMRHGRVDSSGSVGISTSTGFAFVLLGCSSGEATKVQKERSMGSLRGAIGQYVKACFALETFSGHTLSAALRDPGGIIVDLGCNKGDFAAMVLGRFDCRYHAREANPAMVALATKRLGIPVEYLAVTGSEGEIDFHLSGNSEASSVFSSIAGGGSGSIRVPSTTLKAWVIDRGIESVSVLKIDIEGAEHDVIDSWDGSTPRPVQWAVEFHDFIDPSQRPRVLESIAKLKALGYEFINPTWPDHIDCLFVDKSALSGIRGVRLLLGWRCMSVFHRARGWMRRLRRRSP
jgi:FkbM family methyltransferase